MANWLVTVDYDDFELDKAFDALPQIYWKNSTTNQDKGLQVNDIVSVHDKFHRILVLSGFFFLKIASTFLNSSFFPKPIKRRIAI